VGSVASWSLGSCCIEGMDLYSSGSVLSVILDCPKCLANFKSYLCLSLIVLIDFSHLSSCSASFFALVL
jgi:hypothetical protein